GALMDESLAYPGPGVGGVGAGPSRWRRLTEALWVLPVLTAVYLLMVGRYFSPEYCQAIGPDNTYLIVPILAAMDRTAAQGQAPYWMETVAGGARLYSNPHVPSQYPLFLIGSRPSADPVRTPRVVHYLTLAHLLIFYINCYIFLRVAGARPAAALVGATFTAFSANTYQYMGWVHILSAYAWLPLALAGVV